MPLASVGDLNKSPAEIASKWINRILKRFPNACITPCTEPIRGNIRLTQKKVKISRMLIILVFTTGAILKFYESSDTKPRYV